MNVTKLLFCFAIGWLICCLVGSMETVQVGRVLYAQQSSGSDPKTESPVKLIVLGTSQDGGAPQAGCTKQCCIGKWDDLSARRWVSCLAIVDESSGQRWMLDCTPDFREQLRLLDLLAPRQSDILIDGIFPTHAHIGHYTGLMHLGREVLGARGVPVFAMPRMKYFLESNGPWSQLSKLEQIKIERINAGTPVVLNPRVQITPFLVPHRDEFSETVGFQIQGPERTALYLPDIDKWDRWSKTVEEAIAEVDLAFVDGTFFSASELPGRDMSEIPHPLIEESLQRFGKLAANQRDKVHFIHLNHSNPALDPTSQQADAVNTAGCHLARQGDLFQL